MGDALYGNDMLRFARERRDEGLGLQERHEPDASGVCRSCGREHPCDGHQLGVDLAVRYQTFLDSPTPAPDDPPPVTRPFAVTTAPNRGGHWWLSPRR
jgi:hypothetical protein